LRLVGRGKEAATSKPQWQGFALPLNQTDVSLAPMDELVPLLNTGGIMGEEGRRRCFGRYIGIS